MQLEDLIVPVTADTAGLQSGLTSAGMKIRRFGGELRRAFGGIAEEMMKQLAAADTTGQFTAAKQQLQSDLNEIGVTLATDLLPIALQVVQAIDGLIQKFNNLSPEAQKVIAVVGGVVGVLGLLGPIIGGVGSAIAAIGTVVTAVGAPILALFAAIVAAVLLGINMVKIWRADFEMAGIIIHAIWDRLKEKVTLVVEDWKKRFADATAYLLSKFEAAKTKLAIIWEQIKEAIKIALDEIKKWIAGVMSGLQLPSWVKDLLKSGGTGPSNLPNPSNVPWKQGGGSVTAGHSYVVGEQHAEIFTPGQSGNISPAISLDIDYERLAFEIVLALRPALQARP